MNHREGDIAHLSRLAHLDLTGQESALLSERLARLLDWCEVLPPVADGGAGTPPAAAQTLREDVVAPSPGGAGLPADDRRLQGGFVLTPPPSGRCDERD